MPTFVKLGRRSESDLPLRLTSPVPDPFADPPQPPGEEEMAARGPVTRRDLVVFGLLSLVRRVVRAVTAGADVRGRHSWAPGLGAGSTCHAVRPCPIPVLVLSAGADETARAWPHPRVGLRASWTSASIWYMVLLASVVLSSTLWTSKAAALSPWPRNARDWADVRKHAPFFATMLSVVIFMVAAICVMQPAYVPVCPAPLTLFLSGTGAPGAGSALLFDTWDDEFANPLPAYSLLGGVLSSDGANASVALDIADGSAVVNIGASAFNATFSPTDFGSIHIAGVDVPLVGTGSWPMSTLR